MEARQLALFKEPSHLHRHTADRGSSSARVTGRGPGSLKYRTYYSLPQVHRNRLGCDRQRYEKDFKRKPQKSRNRRNSGDQAFDYV